MTVDEIVDRFENTPLTIKLSESSRAVREATQILTKLRKEQDIIHAKYTIEQNKIADKLDKEFPNWRLVLIEDVKASRM